MKLTAPRRSTPSITLQVAWWILICGVQSHIHPLGYKIAISAEITASQNWSENLNDSDESEKRISKPICFSCQWKQTFLPSPLSCLKILKWPTYRMPVLLSFWFPVWKNRIRQSNTLIIINFVSFMILDTQPIYNQYLLDEVFKKT